MNRNYEVFILQIKYGIKRHYEIII